MTNRMNSVQCTQWEIAPEVDTQCVTTIGQLDDLNAQLKRFIRREVDHVASLYEH